jgi:hypothetical protein
MIDSLLSNLYNLVKSQVIKKSHTGYRFEDLTVRKIYQLAERLGLKPNPPRCILEYPTISGICHQFDNSFRVDTTLYVIECKSTRTPIRDHIFCIKAKILDYLFGARIMQRDLVIKGIFLSTVNVQESLMVYAIAYGITVIDPTSPPIEHMLLNVKKDSKTYRALKDLKQKLEDRIFILNFDRCARSNPLNLYKEYRYLCKRWEDEQKSAK